MLNMLPQDEVLILPEELDEEEECLHNYEEEEDFLTDIYDEED